MDGGTALRWALVVLVLLMGAGLVYAVWQLENHSQEQGRER